MTWLLRGRIAESESPRVRLTKREYATALALVTRRRAPVVAGAFGLVVVRGATISFLESDLIPRLDGAALAIRVQHLPSVSLDQSIKTTTEADLVINDVSGGHDGRLQDRAHRGRDRPDAPPLQQPLHLDRYGM